MSFYLIFQILYCPICLELGVGNFCVKDPSNVLVCLYRSSTSTYTLSIPLFLSLRLYFEEHVSLLFWSLFPKYFTYLGWLILIILVLLRSKLFLEMSLPHTFVSVSCLGVTPLTLPPVILLSVHRFLIWWWPLFLLHNLPMTLSPNLVPIFFSLSWKVSLQNFPHTWYYPYWISIKTLPHVIS